MADETPAAANGADTQSQQPNLALQGVYLKDCSYEAPQGPRSEGNWQPQINLDLATTSNPLQGDVREVVLTVTVSAKQGEKTLFLVEVKQAGAFLMQNLSEDDEIKVLRTWKTLESLDDPLERWLKLHEITGIQLDRAWLVIRGLAQ